jgi:hypothetical protein
MSQVDADAFTDIQQLVIDRLDALGDQYKFDTYETDIPVGTDRANEQHAIKPYVIVDFGNRGQQDTYSQGITGTRDNLKYLSIVFEIVSNNPAVTRRITNIVDDSFMGWSPDKTWGEFVNRIAAPLYSRQPSEGGEFYPPRYYRTIAYVVDVDA